MNQKSTSSDLELPFPPLKEIRESVDKPETPEYIIVADINSLVIDSSESLYDAIKLADKIRKAGGAVTVFKATKY